MWSISKCDFKSLNCIYIIYILFYITQCHFMTHNTNLRNCNFISHNCDFISHSYFKLYPIISWKCFHQPQRQYSPLRGSWWAGHHLDSTCWGPTCPAGPFPAGERGAVHSGRQGGTGDGTFQTQTRASVPACVRGGWGEWWAGCCSLRPQDCALGRTAGKNRDRRLRDPSEHRLHKCGCMTKPSFFKRFLNIYDIYDWLVISDDEDNAFFSSIIRGKYNII